ncbi:MAG: RNase adapter RapZ [Ruminococcaceae bacterium]|nr:RNase adapter RapZ [Oscillospiraceae bacterium]
MELVIVTGMSGAGKSVAANALEDIGFYCIDNMPPALIGPVAELSHRGQSDLGRVAIVTDIRGGKMFNELVPVLKNMRDSGVEYKILFLEASNDKIVTRYKETRRSHPMARYSKLSVAQQVEKEREMLKPLKDMADYIIDTTISSTSILKERITNLFLGDISEGMPIQCISFGFKYGCVSEADIVLDVRCLKNPYYVADLKHRTGLEEPVKDFVLDLPEAKGLKEKILSLIDYTVPLYCKEGKSQLVIAIGCTGGKHRSVVFAELIHKHLEENNYRSSVNHRDIGKE